MNFCVVNARALEVRGTALRIRDRHRVAPVLQTSQYQEETLIMRTLSAAQILLAACFAATAPSASFAAETMNVSRSMDYAANPAKTW